MARQLADITRRKTQAVQFYNQKVQNLQEQSQLAVRQVQEAFRQQIGAINADVRMDKRSKESEKVKFLAEFRERIANVKQATLVAKNELDKWAQTRNQTADAATKFQGYMMQRMQQYANEGRLLKQVSEADWAKWTEEYTGNTAQDVANWEYLLQSEGYISFKEAEEEEGNTLNFEDL